jgi:hypothetical protein
MRSDDFVTELLSKITDPMQTFIQLQIDRNTKDTIEKLTAESHQYTRETVREQLRRNKLDCSFSESGLSKVSSDSSSDGNTSD